MLMDILAWCLNPEHAGTIIACSVAAAFLSLIHSEFNRKPY